MTYRVLVVDDEPMLRSVLSRVFARLGFAVDAAEDGIAAVDLLERTTYDLVLCDVRMPGLDGYGALCAARDRLPQLPPWVFLTGYADQPDNRLMRAGARAVLTKPTSVTELRRLLQELGLCDRSD